MSSHEEKPVAAELVAFAIRQGETGGSVTDSIIRMSFAARKTKALPLKYVRGIMIDG